ncbi:hypothetical protein EV126DRAFT_119737 [Verticillium dahliae]|nr:hypothetical protein EV126DRAFT_119737 [Verticillium dahliae]
MLYPLSLFVPILGAAATHPHTCSLPLRPQCSYADREPSRLTFHFDTILSFCPLLPWRLPCQAPAPSCSPLYRGTEQDPWRSRRQSFASQEPSFCVPFSSSHGLAGGEIGGQWASGFLDGREWGMDDQSGERRARLVLWGGEGAAHAKLGASGRHPKGKKGWDGGARAEKKETQYRSASIVGWVRRR